MIDGTIVFCSDSILRFRSDFDEKTALPMTLVQKVVEKGESDPYFLLRFFEHSVFIESGTSLANIFFAIEPWKDMLKAYLGNDVAAYIDEARKPSAITNSNLEWIGIYRKTDIHRAYVREEMGEDEDITAYFNRERTPTDRFSIETSCEASGFKQGVNEHYSISDGLHDIKNLPVILIDKEVTSGYLGKESSLFDASILGVNIDKYGSFVVGETSFTLREMLEAIFKSGLFFYSPKDAMIAHENIKATLAAFDFEQNPSEITSVDEVVDEDEGVVATEEAAQSNDVPKKIVVAPGAFDSLNNHFEHENELWTKIKNSAKDLDGQPIRIGNITEAKPPEVRIHGMVFE
jgi:hypothetical protein